MSSMLPGDGACTRLPVLATDLLREGRGPKRTHGAVWRQGKLILPCLGATSGLLDAPPAAMLCRYT